MARALVQVPSFWRHPINHRRTTKYRRLQEEAVTQDQIFTIQRKLINDCTKEEPSLLIFGYDAPFMETEETLDAIRQKALSNYPTPVSAVITHTEEPSALERLANETRKISLIKTPEKIQQGFLVYGTFGFSEWDSTCLAYHPEEATKGVIFRSVTRILAGGYSPEIVETIDSLVGLFEEKELEAYRKAKSR